MRVARYALAALAALSLAVAAAPVAHAKPPRAADAGRLEPAHTIAVIAGVLKWDEPGLPAFSDHHRKDVELDALLGTLGVPKERRTLLLDADATSDAIKAALVRAIAQAGPEDTLVFYFDGHGILHKGGRIIFASSDARAGKKSGLHLDELPALFTKGRAFKGRRVVLLADCCHSGGLGAVAAALSKAGIDAVALTSAEASKVSTGNWTFTQTLIDCLGGKATCDVDGDGSITLGEVHAEAGDALMYREQQRVGYAPHGVGDGLVLATTRHDDPALEPGQARRGEWVALERGGKTEVGRILGGKGADLVVSLYHYADEERVTVPASAVRPLSGKTWPVGAKIDVLYERQPYLAVVKKVDGWLHLVTYPGWDASWDEWVGPDRIVGAHADRPAGAEPAGPALAAGQVRVEWQGAWYVADVTGKKGELTCVHYVGWGPEWDECVPAARLRTK